METMEQRNAFTEGPILRPLIRFTVPIMLALFLQAMYGAVDRIVVGSLPATPAACPPFRRAAR